MSETITESCGFVRYPNEDGRFTVAKTYPDGRSGIVLPSPKSVTCNFSSPHDSRRLLAFLEAERSPEGPDAWAILAALFPGAASRIDEIMLEIGKLTLLDMAQPPKETS